jgi:pseudouridine-5'-phosphate glycosidase
MGSRRAGVVVRESRAESGTLKVTTPPPEIVLSEPVAAALAAGEPIVALESTIVTHGLPRPRNLEAAREFERAVRRHGALPATIAVLDGVPHVGLTPDQLERIAAADDAVKLSVRDLPSAIVRGATGGTTVAATAWLASASGIRVFATGGIGGVHRQASLTFDESADLGVLARCRITVVSAGIKSILDIGATLERLESLSVLVLAYGTRAFPGFWLSDSGFRVDECAESPEQIAAIMRAGDALGLPGGVLVANPLPSERQLDPELHDRVLGEALAAAADASVQGKDVTPFLLDYVHEHTGHASLDVNVEIVLGNCALAAAIARCWAGLTP